MTRIEANLHALAQLRAALVSLPDSLWKKAVPGISDLRIGPQVRHVLEFYECFLDGLPGRRIDYDARRRNAATESSRSEALRVLRSIEQRLPPISQIDESWTVRVRDDEAEMESTTGRELGSLMNHTVHHMALIAIALAVFCVPVDPFFGVAPATLRYRGRTSGAAA